jgi:hypothetical protein
MIAPASVARLVLVPALLTLGAPQLTLWVAVTVTVGAGLGALVVAVTRRRATVPATP